MEQKKINDQLWQTLTNQGNNEFESQQFWQAQPYYEQALEEAESLLQLCESQLYTIPIIPIYVISFENLAENAKCLGYSHLQQSYLQQLYCRITQLVLNSELPETLRESSFRELSRVFQGLLMFLQSQEHSHFIVKGYLNSHQYLVNRFSAQQAECVGHA